MKISEDPREAASFLREGKIVIFPTETVFGIGANGYDYSACQRIYQIKGRPSDNPLILHVGSLEALSTHGEIDPYLLGKLSIYIPGPLTLILKKKGEGLFSAGLPTVALRVPAHETALEMLKDLPFPVAAPSANLSGMPSLTRFDDVVEVFKEKVDLILKGEDPLHGLESTVIDLSKEDQPLYLRPGVISFEELLPLLPNLKRWKKSEEPPPSPGMKYRHYAPLAKVVMYETKDEISTSLPFSEIGFEVTNMTPHSKKIGSNTEYARELYAFFTLSDKRGMKVIFCQKPQDGPLHEALMERLYKASRTLD